MWSYLYKTLENANYSRVRESTSVVVLEVQGEGVQKEEYSEGDEYFTHLIIVMVSWVHAYVNTYEMVQFKYAQFIVC